MFFFLCTYLSVHFVKGFPNYIVCNMQVEYFTLKKSVYFTFYKICSYYLQGLLNVLRERVLSLHWPLHLKLIRYRFEFLLVLPLLQICFLFSYVCLFLPLIEFILFLLSGELCADFQCLELVMFYINFFFILQKLNQLQRSKLDNPCSLTSTGRHFVKDFVENLFSASLFFR